ncbi:MAG TPA: recombinase family protein [Candidatus Bathyarchaeia archaeon]|nr:recombinase family protein [Candidatus Bathyarchaeia archaeon]
MDRVEQIKISTLQLEALKLRSEGLPIHEIARRLGKSSGAVYNCLQAFEKSYPRLLKMMSEIEKGGYLRGGLPMSGKTWAKGVERSVKAGYFPPGNVPFGYVRAGKELAVDPEKARVVKQTFSGRLQGKTLSQLSKETHLSYKILWRILKNPVYAGKIMWKGKEYSGKHEPLVDMEAWRKAQFIDRPKHGGTAPYGYRWISSHLVVDPEAAAKVKEAFKLRSEGKTLAEVAKAARIPKPTLKRVLRKEIYMGMKATETKLFPIDVEPIVNLEVWRKAQYVGREMWREELKKKGVEVREKILGILNQGPATVNEISEKAGLGRSNLKAHLRRLEKDGMVKKRTISGGQLLWSNKEERSSHNE